jgi:hypothetical protein
MTMNWGSTKMFQWPVVGADPWLVVGKSPTEPHEVKREGLDKMCRLREPTSVNEGFQAIVEETTDGMARLVDKFR